MKKRPRDPNQLAKRVIGIATGELGDEQPPAKNEAAAALGRLGGEARVKATSAKQRAEIASKAAKSRWSKP